MRTARGVAKMTLFLSMAAFFATLATSCRTTQTIVQEKPVYIHDTTQTIREVHDSTYIDRWHTITTKGDTVYVTNTETIVKTLTRTDTAYKVVERPVEVTKKVEVERRLTAWQKFVFRAGGLFLCLLALSAVVGTAYLIYRRRR